MRKPRILQPLRRPAAPRRTELSEYPIAFRLLDPQGERVSEACISRKELHRLMSRAKELDHFALLSIGLHGFTRLDASQSRRVWVDLAALGRLGEPVDTPLMTLVERAAQDARLELVVTAGE